MGKFDRLPCAFCNFSAGSWKTCPNCDAPKIGTGSWLARRWNVPIAKKEGSDNFQGKTAYFHRDGHYWNKLGNFPGAIFDVNGYLLFETEEDYLSHKSLTIKSQTNLSGLVNKLSDAEGYTVGIPPVLNHDKSNRSLSSDATSRVISPPKNQFPDWLTQALNDADD